MAIVDKIPNIVSWNSKMSKDTSNDDGASFAWNDDGASFAWNYSIDGEEEKDKGV
jgi:hypothetical protein